MVAYLLPEGRQSFETASGEPAVGWKLFTYDAGTNTPRPTWKDEAQTAPNTNPIIMDARGEAAIYFNGSYKLVLTDAFGVTIWTQDHVEAVPASIYTDAIYAALAAGGGSALIGFIAAGAGAVLRTMQSKARDIVSVKDYGALGDGLTDDGDAFQAAIAAMAAIGGGTVYIPAGRYVISDGLEMKKRVTVEGAGIDAAVLLPTFAGDLFSIDLTSETPFPGFPDASVYWRNFTIDCQAQTGVNGIKMVNCRNSEIANIKFMGCVSNIYIDRGRKHSIHTIFSEGTDTLKVGNITLTSTDNADYVFESNLYDIHFHNNYVTGTQPVLIYVRRGALILGEMINLNDGYQGNVTAAVGVLLENDCQGCKFSSVIMAALSNGIQLQAGTGPAVAPSFCSFENCDMDQARASSLLIDQASLNSFTNCNFTASGVMTTITSIIARNGAGSNIFSGCRVTGYNGAGGTAMDLSNSIGSVIKGFVISDCTRGVLFGVPCTNTLLEGGLFANVTTPVLGTVGQTANVVKNNLGHKFTSNLAPAVPASGNVIANNTGYAVTVYVVGGTVSVISINGVFTGITSGGVRLEVGDTIAVTYTVLPAWTWIPSWG